MSPDREAFAIQPDSEVAHNGLTGAFMELGGIEAARKEHRLCDRAGLIHARENGEGLGRPRTAALKTVKVRELYREGVSKAEIADRRHIGAPHSADAGV